MEITQKNLENAPATMHQDRNITEAMQAIVELTQHYQDSTLKYSEGIQQYNLQIEKIKLKIDEVIEEKKEDEEAFALCGAEVLYYARLLGESNDTFHQEMASFEELTTEYKESMKVSEYKNIVKKKNQALKKLLHTIEEQEETLLTQELERLNILTILTPKKQQLELLQSQLKHLELEKKHYEASKLQQVIQLPTVGISTDDVIDIDTIEVIKEDQALLVEGN